MEMKAKKENRNPLSSSTSLTPDPHPRESETERSEEDRQRVRHGNCSSDGECCLSGSEPDGSDWSIGWLEPHPNDFCNSDDDSKDSFVVLVPCYRTEHANPLLERTNAGFGFGMSIPTREGLSESNEIFQQWLSSLN